MQVADPMVEYLPIPQFVQAASVDALEYVPAVHAMQEVAPVDVPVSVMEPASHVLQAVALDGLQVPASHVWQAVALDGLQVPASHVWQVSTFD
jgi:hypothetical protein